MFIPVLLAWYWGWRLMDNIRSLALAVLCTAMVGSAFSSRAEGRGGETVFNTCAACHMPTGEGIPGAFPPLIWLPETYAKEGGKEYLISVILQGLNGPITSKGQAYAGFMQAFSPTLNDDEVAGVLNYVLTTIAKNPVNADAPVTAKDVNALRKKIADGTVASSHALRQKLSN